MPTTIRTERLELRPLGDADTGVFHDRLVADPEVMRYYRKPRRARAERDFFEHFRQGAKCHGYVAWGLWATTGQAEGSPAFAGWCGIVTPALEDPSLGPELQYMLATDWQGRGVALEAARAVVADAFSRLDLPRIHIVADIANTRSIRLAERLGFTLRGRVAVQGPDDMHLYVQERPVTVIETGRLVLAELADRDAPFILGLLNEPSFLRFIGDRGVRNLEDARRYIREGPVAGYRRHGHGLLRVGLKMTDTPIGICGVLKRDTLAEPDLGFSLLPAYWSAGYALEAASAVLSDARTRLGLGRVLAIVSPGNEPSFRLLAKLGFKGDALIRLGNETTDVRLLVSEP